MQTDNETNGRIAAVYSLKYTDIAPSFPLVNETVPQFTVRRKSAYIGLHKLYGTGRESDLIKGTGMQARIASATVCRCS